MFVFYSRRFDGVREKLNAKTQRGKTKKAFTLRQSHGKEKKI